MAVIDIDRDVIVIRIIYAGLESAGKSASVAALAEILARKKPQILSVERGFRDTLDFDWLEHTGGFFHGRPITSQIIGIPSKLTTSRRNSLLLESDVVIFVLDVNREKKDENLRYFNQLRKVLARRKEEPIGIVVQANKQDQENTLSSDEIAALFKKYPDIKIIESSATKKRGVRETFVLAVHLAIKQTEQLKITNKLKIGHLDIKTGEELLNFLDKFPDRDEEISDIEDIEDIGDEEESVSIEDFSKKSLEEYRESLDKFEDIQEVEFVDELIDLSQEVAIFEDSVEKSLESSESVNESQDIQEVIKESAHSIFIPNKDSISQWVWPPNAGQRLLKEFLSQILRHSVELEGTQILQSREWLAFSKPKWTYTTVSEVKEALRKYTRLHLHCSSVLSEQRCIAILPEIEGEQRWRLWQILRTHPTLSDQLRMALQAREMNVILLETFKCASRYIEVYQRCSRLSPTLTLNLNNIGIDEDKRLIYLGSIDEPTDNQAQSNADILIDTLKHLFVAPIVKALQHTDINTEVLFKSTLSVLTAPFKRKKTGKKKKN